MEVLEKLPFLTSQGQFKDFGGVETKRCKQKDPITFVCPRNVREDFQGFWLGTKFGMVGLQQLESVNFLDHPHSLTF